jgi:hypothetical protein
METRPVHFDYPMTVRQHVTGLTPRRVTIGPFIVPPEREIPEVLLDIKGRETFDSGVPRSLGMAVKSFKGICTPSEGAAAQVKMECEQDTLFVAAMYTYWLSQCPPQQLASQDAGVLREPFSDPVIASQQEGFSYWRFIGPFRPGVWYFTVEMYDIPSVHPGASAFDADIGLSMDAKPIDNRDQQIMFYCDRAADTDKLLLNKVNKWGVVGNLANVANVKVNEDTVSVGTIESWRRKWLLYRGLHWNGTMDPAYLGAKHTEPKDVTVLTGASTTFKHCSIRLEFQPAGLPPAQTYGRMKTRPYPQNSPRPMRPRPRFAKREDYEMYEVDPTRGEAL